MPLPQLGPRAITRYNRFTKELAAFNYAIRRLKPGPIGIQTRFTLNGLFIVADRLFRHHQDMPRFFQLGIREELTHTDLAIYVARLSIASAEFEARYAHLTEAGIKRSQADRQLEAMDRKVEASLKS